MAIIMIIPGSIEELINYFNFAAWMFYGGAIAGLLWLRYKFPEWKRPIKVSYIEFLALCVSVSVGVSFVSSICMYRVSQKNILK